jgi:hypothetical protein
VMQLEGGLYRNLKLLQHDLLESER